MVNQTPLKRRDCIGCALNILGDKWTPLLLNGLTASPKTFCELEIVLIGISPRTLSQRLDKLEKEDIIGRQLYCKRPPRYRYFLTPKGNGLKDVLQKMADWGDEYALNS